MCPGSMTDDQKEIVRIEAFWIDTWLRSQYDGVTTRYIIHDAVAREVDQHTFYHTRESGGTRISSAYQLANKIIDSEHPPADWNIYVLHFSDGDNWGEDNRQCVSLLKDEIFPRATSLGTAKSKVRTAQGEFFLRTRRGVRGCAGTSRCPRFVIRRESMSRSRNSLDADAKEET